MLFDSSFRKEVARNFSATLIVLLTIVVTVMLVRTLSQATAGRINPSEIVLVLGFTILGYLPIILTLALFVAATATLTRMYAQSEMVVWFSCGRSRFDFVRPLLRQAWPVLLVIALLSLFAWPWSNQQIRELRDRYQGRADIERVAPGQFIESAGGQRVFFIDKDRPDADTGTNIFISSAEHDSDSVVSAQVGQIENRANGSFLTLHNGWRIETDKDTGAMRTSAFEQYEARIAAAAATPSDNRQPRLLSTLTLVRNPLPQYMAELSWRIGLVLAALNCLFIALASARGNPRVGRSAGLVWTLLTFALYYNLIGAGQSWIERGRVAALPFMLLLHGSIFVATLAWVGWRERSGRPRALATGGAA